MNAKWPTGIWAPNVRLISVDIKDMDVSMTPNIATGEIFLQCTMEFLSIEIMVIESLCHEVESQSWLKLLRLEWDDLFHDTAGDRIA